MGILSPGGENGLTLGAENALTWGQRMVSPQGQRTISPGGRERSHPRGRERSHPRSRERSHPRGRERSQPDPENYLTIMKGSKLFLGFLPIDISTAGDFPSRDNGRGQEVHQDLNLPSREGLEVETSFRSSFREEVQSVQDADTD